MTQQFTLERWEYHSVVDPSDEQMELLGLSGWELVGIAAYETGGGVTSGGIGGAKYTVHVKHSFKRPARQRCPDCRSLMRLEGGECPSCGAKVLAHGSIAKVEKLLAADEQVLTEQQLLAKFGITFKWNLFHWNNREFKSAAAAIEAAQSGAR